MDVTPVQGKEDIHNRLVRLRQKRQKPVPIAVPVAIIRQSGGTTIAQDKATSQAFRMPSAAINTGCINFVLPLERIAPALIALAMVQGVSAFFSIPASARYPLTA
jgi:hypothetical protein